MAEINKCKEKLNFYLSNHEEISYDNCLRFKDQNYLLNRITDSYVALKSLEDGNCLYSSLSILLSGGNDLINELRYLSYHELYQNALYYSNHPIIEKILEQHPDLFRTKNEVFTNFLSDQVFERLERDNLVECVKSEAVLNLADKVYSPFLLILALSTVIGMNINCLYSDNYYVKYQSLYTHLIKPRGLNTNRTVAIAWCRLEPEIEYPNHFLPLVIKNLITSTETKKLKQKKISFLPVIDKKTNSIKSTSELLSIGSNQDEPLHKLTLPSCSKNNKDNNLQSSCNTVLDTSLPSRSNNDKDDSSSSSNKENLNKTIDKYDIGQFYNKIEYLNDAEKLNLVNSVWKPPLNFEYPKTNGRRFNPKWLDLFSGLYYSKKLDGVFCLPCVLFGKCSNKKSKLTQLFKEPLSCWPSAFGKLKSHFGLSSDGQTGQGRCDIHKHSLFLFTNFVQRLTHDKGVNVLNNQQILSNRQQNRMILRSIIKTIIFLGQNNLPFCGNKDHFKYHAKPGERSEWEVGLFQNLLNFRIECGDNVLEEHLINAAKNARYTSAPIQNELIKACGNVITKKLVTKTKNSVFFAVIADEVTDISNKQQLAIVVRYLDDDDNIQEDFLKFVHCSEGVTSEDLKNYIFDALK